MKKGSEHKKPVTYAFIDASNLFYGGEKSLGWSIDYQKLLKYLQEKYGTKACYFFGGIDIYTFEFNYLERDTVPLDKLEVYLLAALEHEDLNEAELLLIAQSLDRLRFYQKLESFGFQLILKPVKNYLQDDGTTRRKANVDVDMTFMIMKELSHFSQAVVLSGDGDFLPVLKYMKTVGKKITVLARAPRTAKEIKQFAGSDFRDFVKLERRLHFDKSRQPRHKKEANQAEAVHSKEHEQHKRADMPDIRSTFSNSTVTKQAEPVKQMPHEAAASKKKRRRARHQKRDPGQNHRET